jgi:hypothetical protein
MKLFKKIYRRVRRFFWNIQRLFQWAPVIWNNADWDYEYMLRIERYKLSRMLKSLSRDGVWADQTYSTRDIRICISLIDIILEEDKPHRTYGETAFSGWKMTTRNGKLVILERPENVAYPVHVNLRNKDRFLPGSVGNETSPFKDMLRQEKAMRLYNLIRAYNMTEWFD